MKIKTNNRRIPTISGFDLPETVRAEFDYYESEDELYQASFFKYKGQYWDIGEFTRQSGPSWDGPSWDGCHALTAFSWLLIKLVNKGDAVIVAYCYE